MTKRKQKPSAIQLSMRDQLIREALLSKKLNGQNYCASCNGAGRKHGQPCAICDGKGIL